MRSWWSGPRVTSDMRRLAAIVFVLESLGLHDPQGGDGIVANGKASRVAGLPSQHNRVPEGGDSGTD